MQIGKSQVEKPVSLEGWTWLSNSRKWHYFTPEKISLCSKFMLLALPSDIEQGNDDSPDNCAICRKKLASHKAAARALPPGMAKENER